MRFGACVGVSNPKQIEIIKNNGFDFAECSFSDLSLSEDNVFNEYKLQLEKSNFYCEKANNFINNQFALYGKNINYNSINEYLEKGMYRGASVGLKTIVFGSGSARNIPIDMNFNEAIKQFYYFLQDIVYPKAKEYGIDIAFEPLSRNETNFINTLSEGALICSFLNSDRFYLLADIYHMINVDDKVIDLPRFNGLIKHAHISNPKSINGLKRIFPKDINEFDYTLFIQKLNEANCNTCSIEANALDFENDIIASSKVIKELKKLN